MSTVPTPVIVMSPYDASDAVAFCSTYLMPLKIVRLLSPFKVMVGGIVSINTFSYEVMLLSVTFRVAILLFAIFAVNVIYSSFRSDGTITVAVNLLSFMLMFGFKLESSICAVPDVIVSFTANSSVNVSPVFAYEGFGLLLVKSGRSNLTI